MNACWSLLAQAGQPQGLVFWIDRVARAPLSKVLIFALICTVVRISVFPFLKRTPIHLRTGVYSWAKIANELCDALVYAGIAVFMLIRPFVIQTFFIPSGSMIDTLRIHDYIVANKFVYRVSEPEHGDIVVFKPPKRALHPGQSDTDFIKRLIGKPGDLIEIKNKKLYRNGSPVDEPYVDYTETSFGMGSEPMSTPLPRERWDEVSIPDFKLVEYKGQVWPVQMQSGLVNVAGVAKEYQTTDVAVMQALQGLPAAKIPAGYYLMMGDNRNGSFDSRGWGLVPRDSIIGRSEFIWLPVARWRATR